MTEPTAKELLTEDELRGEGFAFFCWHVLRWPDESSSQYFPCRFDKGFLCANKWRHGER